MTSLNACSAGWYMALARSCQHHDNGEDHVREEDGVEKLESGVSDGERLLLWSS